MKYVLSMLIIIIFLYSIYYIVKNIISKSKLQYNYVISDSIKNVFHSNKKETLKIFIYAFIFRIFIILICIFIYQIFINGNNNFNIIDNFVKWDALHYIRISNGYASYIENNLYPTLVFFPLYPWIIKIVDIIIHYPAISGMIVSTIAYSLACIYIYKLVCLDYNKTIAYKTIILISIAPFSFFFGLIMSESVFLLFSTMTLYYIRKHKWLFVGIFGMLSALSRLIGVFLIIPALVEIFEEYNVLKKIKDFKYIFMIIKKRVIKILIIPLGTLIYLYINYCVTNDWFYFLKMQSQIWAQKFTPFYKICDTLVQLIKYQDVSLTYTVFIPELIIVVVMYFILFIGVKKNKAMYTSWFLIYIIINTSMSYPLSIGRYFTCALPAFIIIAKSCEHKKMLFYSLVILFSLLFGIFLVAFLNDKYVMAHSIRKFTFLIKMI